jgi:hypothetical protein
VLLVVVITLSTLLYTSAPAASPPSVGSGNPGAGAAPANMDAGGENYGWNVQTEPAQTGDSFVERHHKLVSDYYDYAR